MIVRNLLEERLVRLACRQDEFLPRKERAQVLVLAERVGGCIAVFGANAGAAHGVDKRLAFFESDREVARRVVDVAGERHGEGRAGAGFLRDIGFEEERRRRVVRAGEEGLAKRHHART